MNKQLEQDGVRMALNESNELNTKIYEEQKTISKLLNKIYFFGLIVFSIILFCVVFIYWFTKKYHVLGYVGYAT